MLSILLSLVLAALTKLRDFEKQTNNLQAALGQTTTQNLLIGVGKLQVHLESIIKTPTDQTSTNKICDLISNASRRIDEQRWDDAVARLYRAIEAIAQDRLSTEHGIGNTGNVSIDNIPEPLRTEWAANANEGILKLGLQDSFRLLQALKSPMGDLFFSTDLADKQKSPLTARNQSILAHGHQPVGEKIARALFKSALELAGITADNLVTPPNI